MSWRLLLILFLWVCNQIPAAAQNTGDLPLVGVLRLDTPESVKPVATIFRNTLASLGKSMGATFVSSFGSPRDMRSASRSSLKSWCG